MNKASLLALALALGTSGQAFAKVEKKTEGKSSIKIEEVTQKKNKVDGDIDEEITNARMRAESGSKSKFSLSGSVAYTGGPISDPLGKVRPNLQGDPGIQTQTSMGIGLDARYRWSKNDSLTVGTSMGLMTPFQGVTGEENVQLNVFDPNIAYNRVGKIGNIQTSSAFALGVGTSNESQSIKQTADLGASVTGLISGENGLTAGLSMAVGYSFFGNKAGEATDLPTAKPGYYGGDRRTEYSLGIYPFLEYAVNDKIAVRTIFGYFNWKHLYGDDKSARLLQRFVYQSVGVGFAVTRDIYLYPNIQFIPDNIRSDFTNFAMSATLNVF